ncbi:MAG: hypothetical protein Pg6A_07270 [Termitinemataceae bacterium]|nr:MAG: hypothetical protein Pg6A_07270 [Termitinemataceae bacterium]
MDFIAFYDARGRLWQAVGHTSAKPQCGFADCRWRPRASATRLRAGQTPAGRKSRTALFRPAPTLRFAQSRGRQIRQRPAKQGAATHIVRTPVNRFAARGAAGGGSCLWQPRGEICRAKARCAFAQGAACREAARGVAQPAFAPAHGLLTKNML